MELGKLNPRTAKGLTMKFIVLAGRHSSYQPGDVFASDENLADSHGEKFLRMPDDFPEGPAFQSLFSSVQNRNIGELKTLASEMNVDVSSCQDNRQQILGALVRSRL